MRSNWVLNHFYETLKKHNAGYLVLIDPEQCEVEKCAKLARKVERSGADAILLGGSFLTNDLGPIAKALKKETKLPIVLFPGDSMHLTPLCRRYSLYQSHQWTQPELSHRRTG